MVTEEEIKNARKTLRGMLNVGDVIYTNLRHVSRSGMMRIISVHVVKDGELDDITHSVAKALGWKTDNKRWGIRVSGSGMDMGFHVVYTLSRVLFPKGFKTPKGYIRNKPLDFDPDGGFALKQRWM